MFEKLKSDLLNKEKQVNARKIYDHNEIAELTRKYNDLPLSFCKYLMEIGSGSIYDNGFYIWGYLWDAEPMIGTKLLDRYKFFGHGFDGNVSGFDSLNNYSVVEWIHNEYRLVDKNMQFNEYIELICL